jgi:hypothetical protein
MAKIIERVVFKYLFNYFRENFMISVWQSGFLPGMSTITQLIEIYDQFCRAVSHGKDIRVVFLDISKAFDRVWHAGLLFKLKQHGIKGKLLSWLMNYLKDRQQRVTINGATSEWGDIEAGVPQGSVLGPLLFLIFINDVTHVTKFCKIRLFADDTCLFIEVDNHEEAARMLNEDLISINDWSKKWLVSFSPKKTEEMIITNKAPTNHPAIKLNNYPIKTVEHHKHLGLTFSNDLTWKKHVYEIGKKAFNCLGLLRPHKMSMDRRTLETLYKSFIRPVLEYADVVWHIPSDNRHVLDILERVQLEAARVVTGATRRCSTEGLYAEVGWEKLSMRRNFHRALQMFKITIDKAPQYLQDLIPNPITARTRYTLRNRNDLQVPFARLQTYSESFFPSATRQWNALPIQTRSSASIPTFKTNYLKQFPRPSPIQLYYHGLRAPSVAHARMRIGCSMLNYHLYNNLHVISSPKCHCILNVDETPDHYFTECPWYTFDRRILYAELLNIQNLPPINANLLLFGTTLLDAGANLKIFKLVHHFITKTTRFDYTHFST